MNDIAAAHKSEGASLVLDRTFDAPRDLVFEAWTEPKHLVNWWGPNDFTLPHCDVDFRVGGKYRFCMRSPEGEDHWVSGEYKTINEPASLAFTWIREDTSGNALCDTLVTISLEEKNGVTHLTLHHTGFDSLPYRDEHTVGWSECLDRMVSYVTAKNKTLEINMSTEAVNNSKMMNIVGWIFSALVGLLLIASAVAKLVVPVTEETTAGLNHIGWDASKMTGLGILELAVGILFLIPKTSVIGAILVVGYMGGAIATHARVDDPFIVQAMIPIVAWLGLWLREPRLRTILPFR